MYWRRKKVIKMNKSEVSGVVYRVIEQTHEVKPCPVCKVDVLMIKFTYEYKDKEDLWASGQKCRCMGCLGLFEETLTAVE